MTHLAQNLKKNPEFFTTVAGSVVGIAGGIVAICATGGAAAVAVLVIIVVSVTLGLGTAGISQLIDYFKDKKYSSHIEKLVAALKNDQKCFEQFKEELADLRTDSFGFELKLKIGFRQFRGAGLADVRRLTKKAMSSVETLNSRSNSTIKKVFSQFLKSQTNESAKSSPNKDFGDVLSRIVLALKDVGVCLAKYGADDLLRVGGPLALVFGGMSVIYDVKKLIDDIRKKSIGEHFEEMSLEISCLPNREDGLEEDEDIEGDDDIEGEEDIEGNEEEDDIEAGQERLLAIE